MAAAVRWHERQRTLKARLARARSGSSSAASDDVEALKKKLARATERAASALNDSLDRANATMNAIVDLLCKDLNGETRMLKRRRRAFDRMLVKAAKGERPTET